MRAQARVGTKAGKNFIEKLDLRLRNPREGRSKESGKAEHGLIAHEPCILKRCDAANNSDIGRAESWGIRIKHGEPHRPPPANRPCRIHTSLTLDVDAPQRRRAQANQPIQVSVWAGLSHGAISTATVDHKDLANGATLQRCAGSPSNDVPIRLLQSGTIATHAVGAFASNTNS
jgi:hypothetical protein